MTSVRLIAQYILDHLTRQKPLFVALQGPQGSGKSYLTGEVAKFLRASPHSLRVVSLSIDDLYLPYEGLLSLAQSYPDNILWQGRGQPGTHDIDLGLRVLSTLKRGDGSVELPRFDKSLHAGAGDRLPLDGSGYIVTQPPLVDVVIFEGWCVGFHSISKEDLLSRWDGIWKVQQNMLSLDEKQTGRLTDLQSVNEKLKEYERVWDFFDCFIQLKSKAPPSQMISEYAVIYKWRLQQEHHMKSLNGGRGMTDQDVKLFVDRYIPGYVFFGDKDQASSIGKYSLTLILDEDREITKTEVCEAEHSADEVLVYGSTGKCLI